jgi:hypothetical protein
MSGEERVKWVGFDMDECIGNLMPLYSFVKLIPSTVERLYPRTDINAARFAMMQTIIDAELHGRTWLLRPALFTALAYVYTAYKEKKIAGAFIYSNNSSLDLVNFARFLCDGIIWRISKTPNIEMCFKMGVQFNGVGRQPGNYAKHFEEIQQCLEAHELPTMSSRDDLLFFDDSLHYLHGEIPHYVQVPAYRNYTTTYHLAAELNFFAKYIGQAEWGAILKHASKYQVRDAERGKCKIEPQTKQEIAADLALVHASFKRFLDMPIFSLIVRRRSSRRSSV